MARTDERFRAAFNALLDHCETLQLGDQLPPELALADHLEVSRTVVRAALRRLQNLRIIEWEGRSKLLLRAPRPGDRLRVQIDQISKEELERQFLDWVLRFDVPPGTSLNVTELARKFHVPAHGLQEFLASLSRFGLVSRRYNCAPMVYLDNARLTHESDRNSALAILEAGRAVNMVHPLDVAGIEVYAGGATVPGQYGGSTARCGVIVIWTK